jgi:hypothetical protein
MNLDVLIIGYMDEQVKLTPMMLPYGVAKSNLATCEHCST